MVKMSAHLLDGGSTVEGEKMAPSANETYAFLSPSSTEICTIICMNADSSYYIYYYNYWARQPNFKP